MKCPKDKNLLINRIYEAEIEIDECPECQGIWLDAGELEKIQETIENDYSDELKRIPDDISGAFRMAQTQQEGIRECPKCSKPLNKKEYGYCSQIAIDVCASCQGVWLDKKEIKELEIFFERSREETKGIRKGFFGSLIEFFK